MRKLNNRPFRVSPGLCFKTRVGAQPLIQKSFFIPMQKKNNFHKKGCAPSLILKVRVFGTWKWPIENGHVSDQYVKIPPLTN